MKDNKGHGSNGKGGGASAKPSAKGMRLISTHVSGAHSAKVYNNPEWGEKVVQFFRSGAYQPNADYHTDDISDAHDTAKSALARYSDSDAAVAKTISSGSPKSNPVPVHDGMNARDTAIKNFKEGRMTFGDIPAKSAGQSFHDHLDDQTYAGMGPPPKHWSK